VSFAPANEHHLLTMRSLRYSFDGDGSRILEARLPAEAGVLALKALEIALSDLPLPRY